MTLLLALIGSVGVAQAACPSVPGDLEPPIAQAWLAFADLDPEGFRGGHDTVVQTLGCLSDPVPPEIAAKVHVVVGLHAFLSDDEAATIAAFQAARAADPALALGDWLPEGHPVRFEWRLAERLEQAPARDLAAQSGEQVWVDGVAAAPVVLGRPAALQREQARRIAETLYWSGADLPEWAPLAEPRLSKSARRRIGLAAGTALATGATAALLAVGASAHARYIDPSTPYKELSTLERRANTASGAAVGAGVVSAGLGLALVVAW